MTEARVLAIVEQALASQAGEARESFVELACAGNTDLQDRVTRLLALDGSDAPFLRTDSFVRAFGLDDLIAERIGPWRVTAKLRTEQTSRIVKAERDDGMMQQTVAIKLLNGKLVRGNALDEVARARFAEEWRKLSLLRHPAIARLVDGGEHVDRFWLAMEYVDGAPVIEALERRKAGQAERLKAFAVLCDAVAQAHRAQIVHADISPCNVLMGPDGKVHLLDFGVSRLIAGLVIEPAVAYRAPPAPLRNPFAAPERADGGPATVAGDVFALGMLLVAMLTGRNPDGEFARVRGTMLPDGWLKGELATIAARALACRPEARYADVPALIEDLRRFSGHQPLAGRTDARWTYFAGKFVVRHRRAMTLAAASFALLSTSSVVSTLSYHRAEAERAHADTRFADARNTARFMINTLLPRLDRVQGSLPLRAETMAAAQQYVERIAADPQAEPGDRMEAADGLLRLARYQGRAGAPNLAPPGQAMANLRKAEALLAPLPDIPAKDLLARILFEQANVSQWMNSDIAFARNAASRADTLMHTLARPSRDLVRERAVVLADLASWQANFALEARIAKDGLAALSQPSQVADHFARFTLLGNRAEAVFYTAGAAAALPLYQERVAYVRALAKTQPQDIRLITATTLAHWDVASTLLEMKRPDEASGPLREAEASARAAVALDPADEEARRRLRFVRITQAQSLRLMGEIDSALALLTKVRGDDEELLARDPIPLRRRDAAYDQALIGETLAAGNRKTESCAADRIALARYGVLRSSGLLSDLDAASSVQQVRARVMANCPVKARSSSG
jgi:serine/threonine-protein kinase